MKRAPTAGTLGELSAPRVQRTKADLHRCYLAGVAAATRGAAISTCNYKMPERVAAWTEGWESVRRSPAKSRDARLEEWP